MVERKQICEAMGVRTKGKTTIHKLMLRLDFLPIEQINVVIGLSNWFDQPILEVNIESI